MASDAPDLKVVQFPKAQPAQGLLEALDHLRKEVEEGLYDGLVVVAATRDDHVSVIDCAGPSLVRALGLLDAARHVLLTTED